MPFACSRGAPARPAPAFRPSPHTVSPPPLPARSTMHGRRLIVRPCGSTSSPPPPRAGSTGPPSPPGPRSRRRPDRARPRRPAASSCSPGSTRRSWSAASAGTCTPCPSPWPPPGTRSPSSPGTPTAHPWRSTPTASASSAPPRTRHLPAGHLLPAGLDHGVQPHPHPRRTTRHRSRPLRRHPRPRLARRPHRDDPAGEHLGHPARQHHPRHRGRPAPGLAARGDEPRHPLASSGGWPASRAG